MVSVDGQMFEQTIWPFYFQRICRQTPVVETTLHYGAGKNLSLSLELFRIKQNFIVKCNYGKNNFTPGYGCIFSGSRRKREPSV